MNKCLSTPSGCCKDRPRSRVILADGSHGRTDEPLAACRHRSRDERGQWAPLLASQLLGQPSGTFCAGGRGADRRRVQSLRRREGRRPKAGAVVAQAGGAPTEGGCSRCAGGRGADRRRVQSLRRREGRRLKAGAVAAQAGGVPTEGGCSRCAGGRGSDARGQGVQRSGGTGHKCACTSAEMWERMCYLATLPGCTKIKNTI